MSNNEGRQIETEEEKLDKTKHLISLIVSVVILSAIVVGVALISVYVREIPFSGSGVWRVLSDSFAVAGLLGICFYLLVLASDAGTFDILVYGVKKTFLLHIFKNYKGMVPATFAEYVAEKRGRDSHKTYTVLLCYASLLLALGIIFLILFYTVA